VTVAVAAKDGAPEKAVAAKDATIQGVGAAAGTAAAAKNQAVAGATAANDMAAEKAVAAKDATVQGVGAAAGTGAADKD